MGIARGVTARLSALLAGWIIGVSIAIAAPSGPPVKIGSTLALTGPLAATGQVHKIVGEIYVEELNKKSRTSRARCTSSSSPSTRSIS